MKTNLFLTLLMFTALAEAKSGFEQCTQFFPYPRSPRECQTAQDGYTECRKCGVYGESHENCLMAQAGYCKCRTQKPYGMPHQDCIRPLKGFDDCINFNGGQPPEFCVGIRPDYKLCRERGHAHTACLL